MLRVRLWLGALLATASATGAAASATGAAAAATGAAAAATGAATVTIATAATRSAASATGATPASATGAAPTAATGAAASATGSAAATATGAVKVTKAASRWCPRRRGSGRGRRTLAPAADFTSIGTAVAEAHTQAVAIACPFALIAFALLAGHADSATITRGTHTRI